MAVSKIASCRVSEISEWDIENVESFKTAKYWAQSSQFKVWFMALSDSPGTTLQD